MGSLSEYRDLRPIGKGKFSTVCQAYRKSDNLAVAIKNIHGFSKLSDTKRSKTLREVSLLGKVQHPNIIQFIEAFEEESALHIVFEWASAGDLKRQIHKMRKRKSRFSERLIWKYFLQISEAIEHMHAQRVMHRDLKPANIFLTRKGVIKVGDLGLGRELSQNTTAAFSKVGTPLYMSPEVLTGKGYEWKSDVWSLGCILYELAVLRSPFKEPGIKLHDLFKKIAKGIFEPVEGYSRELRDLTQNMINVDPNVRPAMKAVCRFARTMTVKLAKEARLRMREQENKDKENALAEARAQQERARVAALRKAQAKAAHKELWRLRGVLEQDGDALVQKLQILDYEARFIGRKSLSMQLENSAVARAAAWWWRRWRRERPFDRCYFVLPIILQPTELKMDRSKSKPETWQWNDASALFGWLLGLLQKPFPPVNVLDSDILLKPVALANMLLLTLDQVGIADSLLKSTSSSLVVRGYGAPVLSLLNATADLCIERREGWAPKDIQYGVEVDECVPDAEVLDMEADAPDEASSSEEEEAAAAAAPLLDNSNNLDHNHSIIPRMEDPVLVAEWRQETARLSKQLRRISHVQLPEWRYNLQANVQRLRWLLDASNWRKPFEALSAEISARTSLIAGYEAELMSDVAALAEEYAAKLSRLRDVTAVVEQRSTAVSLATEKLAFMTDACDAMEQQLEERKSELSSHNAVTKIRSAIGKIKQETKDMSVRIGLVQAQLDQAGRGGLFVEEDHNYSDDSFEESRDGDL